VLLRLSALAFLLFASSVLAATPPAPDRQPILPTAKVVLQLAMKEMPLPVVRVLAWSLSEGKQRFVVELSAARLPWALKPLLQITFQTEDKDLEQAVYEASSRARAFLEAAKADPAIQAARW
jgi:hypothetical protein